MSDFTPTTGWVEAGWIRIRAFDGIHGEEACREFGRWLAEHDRQIRAEALPILGDLTDPDDCWFDHHGNCQAHGWFEVDPPCPHGRAKAYVATWHRFGMRPAD